MIPSLLIPHYVTPCYSTSCLTSESGETVILLLELVSSSSWRDPLQKHKVFDLPLPLSMCSSYAASDLATCNSSGRVGDTAYLINLEFVTARFYVIIILSIVSNVIHEVKPHVLP